MLRKLDIGMSEIEQVEIFNSLVDTVNRLEESVQGVVNNSIADDGRIRLLQEQIHALKTTMANNANVAENCECAKNAHKSDLEEALEGFPGLFKSNKDEPLVDAINELKAKVAITEECLHPTAKVAPYAEQDEWIGKLCRFWFADVEHPTFGILDFVDAGPHPEPFHINCGESEQGWYPHCEPVKPDDNIIFKGGKDEL